MGPNQTLSFKFDPFDGYEFGDLPKGDMFRCAMNPYNGNVFFHFQRSRSAQSVALEVMRYIVSNVDALGDILETGSVGFGDFKLYLDGELDLGQFQPCPFCGHSPEVCVSSVDVRGDRTYPEFEIVCCDGRTRIDGFSSRFEAVSFWNSRYQRKDVA